MLFARLHKLRSIRTPQVLSAFLPRFDAPSINQSVSQSVESLQSSDNCNLATACYWSFWQHLEYLKTAIFLCVFIWDENCCERYDFINLKIKMDSAKRPNTITSMKIFVSYRFVSARSCWIWQKASKMNKTKKMKTII